MKYDLIIIGGGLSGLAAGIRSAHFGYRVCILEQQGRIGGLNSYYNYQGRIFDIGLHAITNYVPRHIKSTPLAKTLRQLRLSYNDFQLLPQQISRITFPTKELRFSNDFNFFIQEISEKFPHQIDQFTKFVQSLKGYDEFSTKKEFVSTRQILQSFFSDPLLIEMLLCPLMFYGCSWENDIDFAQFSVLFRSIFCEGFARPQDGMSKIIQLLKTKYQHCGGELKTNCKVQKLCIHQNQAKEVLLANGQIMKAEKIISCIGLPETKTLCTSWGDRATNLTIAQRHGALSFMECILILKTLPSQLLFDTTILFYNDSEHFLYQRPKTLIDTSSGVICCPNNYQSEKPLSEGMIRITHLANFALWNGLNKEEYQVQKKLCLRESLKRVEKFIPGLQDTILIHDIFTPKTIEKFTGRRQGAVYGTPDKTKDGLTPIKNLFICGTDQGYLGIIGSMLSGISMANSHILY